MSSPCQTGTSARDGDWCIRQGTPWALQRPHSRGSGTSRPRGVRPSIGRPWKNRSISRPLHGSPSPRAARGPAGCVQQRTLPATLHYFFGACRPSIPGDKADRTGTSWSTWLTHFDDSTPPRVLGRLRWDLMRSREDRVGIPLSHWGPVPPVSTWPGGIRKAGDPIRAEPKT